MNLAPNPMPSGHLVKGNSTWNPLAPGVEPSPWEYHIIVVVVIFGLVCLMHLAAFLYAICFQNHGHYRPVTAHRSHRSAGNESEIATFYPSPPPGNTSDGQQRSDAKEEHSIQQDSTFWGNFLRQA